MRVVLSGTGTEIGKTHVAEAVLRAAVGGGLSAAGWKPVESGVTPETSDASDAARLARAGSFHVKHLPPTTTFPEPISPHLAARLHGVDLDPTVIAQAAAQLPAADLHLVELAGGLFSPLRTRPALTNADLALALAPDALLLIAPDRLGVLHDVRAVLLALAAVSSASPRVVLALSAPSTPDASTGTNAAELAALYDLEAFALPRAPAEELATTPAVRRLLDALLLGRTGPTPSAKR